MIKKLKSFLILPILLISIFCIPLISACNKDQTTTTKKTTLTTSSNIKSAADGVISVLSNEIYNYDFGAEPKTYTLEEIKTMFTDLNYYVEIGSVANVNDVSSIGLNDLTFNKNEEFHLSIGKNNFIKTKAYMYEGGKLYIAAPILAFETVNNAKLKINGVEHNFDLGVTTTSLAFDEIKWQSGSPNTIEVVENTNNKEYNLGVTNSTTWLGFYYENASANDVILTRRITNGKLNGYGLTKGENVTGNPLALYIVVYNSDLKARKI